MEVQRETATRPAPGGALILFHSLQDYVFSQELGENQCFQQLWGLVEGVWAQGRSPEGIRVGCPGAEACSIQARGGPPRWTVAMATLPAAALGKYGFQRGPCSPWGLSVEPAWASQMGGQWGPLGWGGPVCEEMSLWVPPLPLGPQTCFLEAPLPKLLLLGSEKKCKHQECALSPGNRVCVCVIGGRKGSLDKKQQCHTGLLGVEGLAVLDRQQASQARQNKPLGTVHPVGDEYQRSKISG